MPIPQPQPSINRSFMRDEVYDTLLRWIMEGVLRPGEKLLDKDLAETLGVSRTPVREALRRLEDKGLVEASAGRWTRVAKINIEEAEQIYPVIWALEVLAADLAMARFTPDDFEAMARANADLDAAIRAREPVKASKADSRFHDVIIQKTNNPHLIGILEDLKVKRRRLEVIYFEGSAFASSSVAEHTEILSALRENRRQDVIQLIKTNWKGSLERVREQLQSELT